MNSTMNSTTLVLLATLGSAAVPAVSAEAPKPVAKQLAPRPQAPAQRGMKSGRMPINGIDYYYEVRGAGEPLLLLHGGLGSIDMFGPLLPQLSAHRRVIAVDLQGHGRTPLGDRPLSLTAMGDDMAALVKALGLQQVDVLGYSLGGGVAFRLAVQHPETVRRLVLVSTGFAPDGFYPEMLPPMAQLGAAMA